MADIAFSNLPNEIAEVIAGDMLAIDDISAGETKKIKIESLVGGNVFYPDRNETDQGVTGNGKTIKAAVDAIGSDRGAIHLRHTSGGVTTPYVLTTAETIPTGINLIKEHGATIGGAGVLTLNGILSFPNGVISGARGLGHPFTPANVAAAAALTHSNTDFVYSFNNGKVIANDIYGAIYSGVDNYDIVQAVIDIHADSTIDHAAAVAGYVKNQSPSSGAGSNGVALFGCAQGTVNNAHVWGVNTLLQDDIARLGSAGSGTGRKLLNELDFNVMHTASEIIGLSVGGNSIAQPTTANGFIINVLGTGIRWVTGFYVMDNACSNNGLYLGCVGDPASASINSSKLVFKHTDATPTAVLTSFEALAYGGVDYLVLSNNGTDFRLKIANGNLLLDTGHKIYINGIQVLTDRQTGWTAATGTADRTTFVTSSVSLPELAERVKALIDDGISHGLIGT